MAEDAQIRERLRLSLLFDLYGALLTDKQRECMKLSLCEDFSLSEIGDALGISRQAASDMLHRSAHALEYYEERLKFATLQEQEYQNVYKLIRDTMNKLRREEYTEAIHILQNAKEKYANVFLPEYAAIDKR